MADPLQHWYDELLIDDSQYRPTEIEQYSRKGSKNQSSCLASFPNRNHQSSYQCNYRDHSQYRPYILQDYPEKMQDRMQNKPKKRPDGVCDISKKPQYLTYQPTDPKNYFENDPKNPIDQYR